MSTNVFLVWVDRLDSGTLTKSQISQFAQAITRRALDMLPHGKRTALTDDECGRLFRRIQRNPVLLTSEHTDQGVRWLSNHGRRALDMDRATHDDLMSHFDHFSWDGEIAVCGANDNTSLPVWTVGLSDGRELRYYNAAWMTSPDTAAYWWADTCEDRSQRNTGGPRPRCDELDDLGEYDSLSADASRVAALADEAIEDWNRLVRDTKKRTERLRSAK